MAGWRLAHPQLLEHTGYDYRTSPPTPIKGRDALYSTPRNAAMARRFGLRWMVTTDHGGPYHSKVEQAHRELTLSRILPSRGSG